MKLTHGLILGGIVLGIFLGYGLRGAPGVGISYNTPTIDSTTNSSSSCTGTSSIVVASNTARTSFITTNADLGDIIYLCRAESCVTETGIPLASTTPQYEQKDQYRGSYSCVAANATVLSHEESP